MRDGGACVTFGSEDFALLARRHGLDVEPLDNEYTGVNVRTLADGKEVWVVRLLVNWRVLETLPYAFSYGRFWCYPGTGPQTFIVACTHASLYGDGEPDGWVKSWDGRVGAQWGRLA